MHAVLREWLTIQHSHEHDSSSIDSQIISKRCPVIIAMLFMLRKRATQSGWFQLQHADEGYSLYAVNCVEFGCYSA